MKDGKLQIGFIGCGGIAFNKHFPSLQALPDLCDMVMSPAGNIPFHYSKSTDFLSAADFLARSIT